MSSFPSISTYANSTYLINLPNVILVIEIGILDLISPKQIVMALPNIGTKAKNPIHAP